MAPFDYVCSVGWLLIFAPAVVYVIYSGVQTLIAYHRLKHIPGPWIASFSSAWLFYQTFRGRIHHACDEIFEKHDTHIVRIGPNMVVTEDPDLIRTILAPRSGFRRGFWFEGMRLDPRRDNLLSTRDDVAHARLRAKLMPGYSGKEVFTLEADIDKGVRELIDLIDRDYIQTQHMFDFAVLSGYFSLDNLSKIAFGNRIGYLKENRDIFDFFKTCDQMFPIMDLGANHPFMSRLLRLGFAVAGPNPGDAIGMGALLGAARESISARFKAVARPDTGLEKMPHDMLGSFMRHGLGQDQCETEALLQIIAGSDSTAHALRNTFVRIVSNPPAYIRLVAEIDEAVRNGKASHPVVSNHQVQALPYLQACMKEGIRTFMPLNGLAFRQNVSDEEFVWNGVSIPRGTEVGLPLYSMLRRKDIFAPDAETFRPERWLETDDPESLRTKQRVFELAFSSGGSSCPGKSIALMEVGKAIFELFRVYDFWMVDPLMPIQTKVNGAVLQKGIFVGARKREAAK